MTRSYKYHNADDDIKYQNMNVGPGLLIGVCLYSTLCIILLPIFITLGKKWRKRRTRDVIIDSHLSEHVNVGTTAHDSDCIYIDMVELEEDDEASTVIDEKEHRCQISDDAGIDCDEEFDEESAKVTNSSSRPCAKMLYNRVGCHNLKQIVRYDDETKKIFKLGGPFILSGITEALFSTLTIVAISRYCQVQVLSAYVMSNLVIELSLTLIGGIPDAITTLCSHAIGADNYKIAGSYAQISTVLYVIMSLPLLGFWWLCIGRSLQCLGLDEIAVEIGTKYTKIVIFQYLIEGIYDALYVLLDINGYELYTTYSGIVHGGVELGLVWLLLATVKGFDLFWVGVTHLCVDILWNSTFLGIAISLGWFDAFWEGLVKTCALSNKSAVWTVLSTAIPLSVGSLLEYGEVLTMFAAALGPTEVAVWGLMESIWELFEAATEGFAEAGSIRLAKHLGKGDIQTSKQSCSKSLFINTCLATIITAIFYLFRDSIATWLTDDETLQSIINSMIPLIGVGNVFMAFGTTSWALIGAQGRFKTSTIISGAVSCLVTVPLAGLFCVHWGLGLDGLVASIVIGYTTVSFWMSLVLLMSDWDGISLRIIEENEENDDSSTDSESDNAGDNDDDYYDDLVFELHMDKFDELGEIFSP